MGQRGGQGRTAGWLVALVILVTSLTGCGQGAAVAPSDATVTGRVDVPWGASDAGSDAAADAADVSTRFPCPEGWVASEHGGCGPAVLLCAPDGGAAEGACEGNDPTSPATVRDPDGAEGTRFYRLPDGGIGGAWSTPWVCPTGWTNAPEGHCRPTLRDDCPRYSGPLPDGTCTPTDESRCPPGGFPEVPPEAAGQRVVYVRQMATLTPDGSMRAPYPDLNQAVAAEPEAEWFLLYPGHYPVGFTVRHPMHILGGCAANVQLTGTNAAQLFLLDGPAIRLDLRGVSLSGGSHTIFARNRAEATLRSCVLSQARYNAIEANDGARVEAVDSMFDDLNSASMGHHGIAGAGGHLTLRRSSFPGTAYISVIAENAGATAIAENVAIRGTRATTVQATDGATLTLRQASIRGQTNIAVVLWANAHAEIEDLAIRDTSVVAIDGVRNGAIGVRDGCSLVGRRISVDNASGYGLRAPRRGHRHGRPVVPSHRAGRPGGWRQRREWSSSSAHLPPTRAARRHRRHRHRRHCSGSLDVRDSPDPPGRPSGQRPLGHRHGGEPPGQPRRPSRGHRAGLDDGHRRRRPARARHPPRRPRRRRGPHRRPARPHRAGGRHRARRAPARALPRRGHHHGRRGVHHRSTGQRRPAARPRRRHQRTSASTPRCCRRRRRPRRPVARQDQVATLRVLLGPVLDGPSTATLDGVFVRGIRRWRVGYEASTPDRPLDDLGAYSFYTGPRCTFTATDVTLDGSPSAEIGLASLGATTLRRGVVTRHTGCAATLNNTNGSASITLDSITLSGNGRDATCADDALPSVRLPLSPN
nr:hypothetical protein [Deltaproteobacteria bacterium]